MRPTLQLYDMRQASDSLSGRNLRNVAPCLKPAASEGIVPDLGHHERVQRCERSLIAGVRVEPRVLDLSLQDHRQSVENRPLYLDRHCAGDDSSC